MQPTVSVQPVLSLRDLRRFVTFPWRVYRDDANWVPPLIADQMAQLDSSRGPFFKQADVILYLARSGDDVVGTIAAYVDRAQVERSGQPVGYFGFFEVIDDYDAAQALLDTACSWLREKGMREVRGPYNFNDNDRPGILIAGADCPPVMMEAHNPSYYRVFVERFGMQKDHDLYAWRAFREQIGEELKNIPPELNRVAEVARKTANITVRTLKMENWDKEIETACELFNVTLNHLPDYVPFPLEDFRRMAGQLRSFIDPELALFAEVEDKTVGFCVALPDTNRVLIHLNGHLFPFNWLRVKQYIRQIDVVSFKLMGILEEYRRRGIDALLYLEVIRAIYRKGYAWLDGSVTSEYNTVVNLLANRLGAERYKHYRIYRMDL
jgi:GNAT superfamily N-acetyltransferase